MAKFGSQKVWGKMWWKENREKKWKKNRSKIKKRFKVNNLFLYASSNSFDLFSCVI